MMSVQAMQWARGKAASATAQLILFGLADHADTAGVTYVGQATIAKHCSCGERTVRDNLAKLEEIALIARVPRRNVKGWRSSDYTILAPRSTDRAEMDDVTEDEAENGRYPVEVAWLARETQPADHAARTTQPARAAARPEVQPADDSAPNGSSLQTNRQMAPSLPAPAAGEQLVGAVRSEQSDVEHTAAFAAAADDDEDWINNAGRARR